MEMESYLSQKQFLTMNKLILTYILIHVDMQCNAATRVKVNAPVNPIDEGGILSVHCQIWNLQKGQEITIYRNRTHFGDNERLSLNNQVHKEDNNVFLAERQMLDGSTVYFLSIMSATRDDEGEYFCQISSVTGSIYGYPNDSVKISFTYFPTETDPSCAPSGPLRVKEGSDVSFVCSSETGYPLVTLQWKRTGSASMLKSNVRTHVQNGRVHVSLTFQPSYTSSGAIYICTVKSVAFPNIERTCHVGPVTVLRKDGIPYPDIETDQEIESDSDDFQLSEHQLTLNPMTTPIKTNIVKTSDLSCDEQCPLLVPGSPVQFWIIATIAAVILTVIFLILGVVIMIKYYRLSNIPGMDYGPPALPHSEEIYVEVDGKRRENYMYMSLEKSQKPVFQPIQMSS